MKRIIALALAIVLVFCVLPSAFAASDTAVQSANVLHSLGLFEGVGIDVNGSPNYDLDRASTRVEAITMLVRLLGKEEEAKNGTWSTPFSDVPAWAMPYVGYAYTNKLTMGTGTTTFGSYDNVSATQYLTFVLRALGYESGTDFQWDKAWDLSDKIGLTNGEYNEKSSDILRGDVVIISNKALPVVQKNSAETLADKLIAEGVFTKVQFDNAMFGEISIPKILSAEYSFVRIDDTLYEIVYSYEFKDRHTNVICYDADNPSSTFLDGRAKYDMWTNAVTFSLLTHTFKTTSTDNPFVDSAIDLFSTYYDSPTITVSTQKQYLSAIEINYSLLHSYCGKTLQIPSEVSRSTGSNIVTSIDEIRYCGRYINLEDYCKYFSLNVSVAVEFDESLEQNIVVVRYY